MSRSAEKDGDSAGRAVLLEDVDGVGDEGGGIGVNEDEVKERVGPGEGSDDETRDGVRSEDGDDRDDDDQASDDRSSYSSPSTASRSPYKRSLSE